MVYREKQYGGTLCHFNPNHDPRNGQFAKTSGGSSRRTTRTIDRTNPLYYPVPTKKQAKKIGKFVGITSGIAAVGAIGLLATGNKVLKDVSGGTIGVTPLGAVRETTLAAGRQAIRSGLIAIGVTTISNAVKAHKIKSEGKKD